MVTPTAQGDADAWCRDVSAAETVLSRVESEMETHAPIICQTVELGENLMREIQSETDYPPGYLVTIPPFDQPPYFYAEISVTRKYCQMSIKVAQKMIILTPLKKLPKNVVKIIVAKMLPKSNKSPNLVTLAE